MVSILAQKQLEAWQEFAATWRTMAVPSEKNSDLIECRCHACGTTIYQMTDRWGKIYQYSDGSVMSMTVAHLRNQHREYEDLVYQNWESHNAGTIS